MDPIYIENDPSKEVRFEDGQYKSDMTDGKKLFKTW